MGATDSKDAFAMGLERFNALLASRGFPNGNSRKNRFLFKRAECVNPYLPLRSQCAAVIPPGRMEKS
jgi:hypothetical protein